jgi:alpha-tubulin suppressor-like RCC1 family protein
LTSGVTSLSAGGYHTCALLDSGAVRCWGRNADSVLGDGTSQDRKTPVDVIGIPDATAIAAGARHQCALRTGGTLMCWGDDARGQMGQDHTWETAPVDVPLPAAVTSISAGWFSVAVAAGDAIGWGQSVSNGGLVLGASTTRTSPTKMTALAGSAEIGLGYADGCARDGAGGVKCWGANFFGEVGSGNSGVRASAGVGSGPDERRRGHRRQLQLRLVLSSAAA